MIHSVCISNCVGPTSPVPLKGDLKNCIYLAKHLGFDGVELHMRNPALDDYHEIADRAAEVGIKITHIGTGMACYADGHYLTNPDKEALKAAQQVLIDWLEAGKVCGGAGVMFGLMKGPLPDYKKREQYKDLLYENLLPVVDAAERCCCDFTIEGVNRFQADYLWDAYETLEFVERFKSDYVSVHLDTFHMNIEDKDMREAIMICGKKLGHFHFSDNDRCYPGHSRIDYKEIVDALYDVGYYENGVGGYEFNAIPDGVTAAVRGLAHIKQFERK